MKSKKLGDNPEYIKKMCYTFAKECVTTNLDEYNERGQNITEKIIKDIYLGKLAEFLVFDFFINKGKKLTPPDLFIYDKKNKSFDPDLIVLGDNIINIHVKSHGLSSDYPISWLFENRDVLVNNPSENDFLALCCLSSNNNYMYLVKADKVKDIYKNPVKKNLKKSVIYEEDLLNLEI